MKTSLYLKIKRQQDIQGDIVLEYCAVSSLIWKEYSLLLLFLHIPSLLPLHSQFNLSTPTTTMTEKPIFVATHPRACSTAFERVFYHPWMNF